VRTAALQHTERRRRRRLPVRGTELPELRTRPCSAPAHCHAHAHRAQCSHSAPEVDGCI